MKKKNVQTLGDLIAALFEEADKVCSQPSEQRLIVYAPLKDLLSRKVTSEHPIVFQS